MIKILKILSNTNKILLDINESWTYKSKEKKSKNDIIPSVD